MVAEEAADGPTAGIVFPRLQEANDGFSQKELWRLGSSRAPAVPSKCADASASAAPAPELGLADALSARGRWLFEFELERALRGEREDHGQELPSGSSPHERSADAQGSTQEWRLIGVAPRGSPAARRPAQQLLPSPASDMSVPMGAATGYNQPEPRMPREERIRNLEADMLLHDGENLFRIAKGTAPLLDRHGAPQLPIPPLDYAAPPPRGVSRGRGAAQDKQDAERRLRTLVGARQLLGVDAQRRQGTKAQAQAEKQLAQQQLGTAAPTLRVAAGPDKRRDPAAEEAKSFEDLLAEVEALRGGDAAGGADHRASVAAKCCAQAHSAEVPDILRLVRALAAVARHTGSKGAPPVKAAAVVRKELLQAADHLLQGLTMRLRGASLETLLDVLDTMSDARIGTQVYLDMIMALVLACHHRDCRALSPAITLRLASSLGRVGALRLRPGGAGGLNTIPNIKVMEELMKRVLDYIEEFKAEDLACLDVYFVTRLCGELESRAIVVRMAQLEIGLRDATKQYLPLMTRMQENLMRERGTAFSWSLPRFARQYLEQLKTLNLADPPWDRVSMFRH